MPAYASQAQLADEFGEAVLTDLTDRSDAGTPDAARIADCLLRVSGVIDTYVGVRYPLPLDTTPQELTEAAMDLALYRLYDGKATDQVRQRYEDRIRWLERLAAGLVVLTLSPVQAETASAMAAGTKPLAFGAAFATAYRGLGSADL